MKIRVNRLISRLHSVNRDVTHGIAKFIEMVGEPRLKVAIISYYFEAPTLSGVGVHAKNLAEHLSKSGCEVHVFCSSSEGSNYKDNGVTIHPIEPILIPHGDQFSGQMLDYDVFESEVIKELIRENATRRFDIIHTHGALTKAEFILKKTRGIRWVHTFHAIEKLRVRQLSREEKDFEDLISWIESTVNHCDGAIFVSKSLLDEARGHYTLKSTRVIPNGVDLSVFSCSPITKKNVLFIGRFSKEKGIEYLPGIIARVMEVKDATFTAVCPYDTLGDDLKEIRGIMQKQEEHFKGRIRIIEKRQHPETLRKLYSDCQVYIQPSKYESFGICIVEAMATGRPVVSFNVGGIPEVIGGAGIIAHNKNEMTHAIVELLEDKKRCADIGKMASERVRMFDWDSIAKTIIGYYNEVAK